MDTPSTLETLQARMTAAKLTSDVDPLARVEAVQSDELHTVAAHSQLERMLHALQPLNVARETAGCPLSARPPSGAGPHAEFDLVVRGRLGEGGMGVVELAEQRSLGREVALKRLHVKPRNEAEGYALLDEARIHGSLEHPNVAPVHAVGADRDFGPVVVLKRVTGQSWGEALRADATRLPQEPDALERHLRVLIQVCHALDYAHSRGVLHRDVKPENVMLGEFGEVYLMDWGLALRRDALVRGRPVPIAGTPAYMAPEMVRGDAESIDERSDVFLLGATLHELLCGTPRHLAESMSATMLRALRAEGVVYGAEVPADLGAIANRACALDPGMRFANVRAFREAIEGFLSLRDTQALVASAEALLDTSDSNDPRPFYQAQFVLEQALRARPGLPSARRALTRCRGQMLQQALAEGDLRRAEVVLTELGDAATATQRDGLASARAGQERERARVAALERDADPSIANAVRLRAITVVFVLVSVAQGAQLIADPSPGFTANPIALLYSSIGTMVVAGLYLAFRARDLAVTAIDRQFLQAISGITLAAVASRTAGILRGEDVPTILMRDTFLFAIVFVVVRVPMRGSLVLGLVGLGFGVMSAQWHGLARYLHMALVEFVVLGVLIDILLEGRRLARTRARASVSLRPPR